MIFWLLIAALLFMSIGYSAINSVTGDISGTVTAKVQDGVFITDVEQTSNVDANLTTSKIKSYVGTLMGSTVDLSKENPSSEITYKVTVYNNANETMQFSKVVYDEGLDVSYDNLNITFEISGFTVGQTIEPNETKEIIIKFKYKDQSSVPENTVLNSYIQFKMSKINRMVIAQNGSNTNKYLTGTILKNQIESVKFEQGEEPTSTNIIEKFDASEKQDESIIGYYTDNDSNGLYELTFVSENTIYANKDASYLFQELINLQSIEFDNFRTFGTNKLIRTFQSCHKIQKLDLKNWDTSQVKEFGHVGWASSGVFQDCTNLSDLDISNWNTSSATDFSKMFFGCNEITDLDLSNLDTSNVKNMESMFENCSKLYNLKFGSIDTSNVISMGGLFKSDTNLVNLDLSAFNTEKVIDMQRMFDNCNSLEKLDLSNFKTSQVANMQYMFSNCGNLVSLNLGDFDTSQVTNMNSMFNNCGKLRSLDISGFDTSQVKGMDGMFYGCKSLKELDLSNWNTENVTTMGSMFRFCNSLDSLNISRFDTSNVTNMAFMFYELKSLKELDLSNWNTENVTNMFYMFYFCTELKELDLKRI